MNPQLANKIAVLYITKEGVGSQRAFSIAQSIPEVYIQDVGLLTQEQVPHWLKEVPTCVNLSTMSVHTGSAALKLLMDIYEAKQNALKEQFAAKTNPQQYQQPQQQSSQYMQQQYTAQMEGRLYSPQQRSAAAAAATQGLPHRLEPNGQQRQVQQSAQNQKPTGEVLRGSLQPASGSGNYGCSLDAAFAPMEEVQEQPTESRLSKAGKIDQNDIESYMRMREKTGAGQPNVLQQ